MKLKILAGTAITAILLSCEQESLNIGNSLTNVSDILEMTETNYEVQTRTIVADSVLSRCPTCYFGKIKDPETGTYVTTDFMTQFHLLEGFTLVDQDSIVSRIDGEIVADSCEITLYMQDLALPQDTLTAMKMRLRELGVPASEDNIYYSNFDPSQMGLIRNGGLQQSKMFTYSDLTVSDSLRNTTGYYNNIRILLNKPYTDKQGKTYNNYGTYVLRQYYAHPEYFSDSYQFIQNVCPGFFFEITDGQGFHSDIPEISLRVNYTMTSSDSIFKNTVTLAGTKEVLQTLRITNDKERLQELANDQSCTYIKSPAGLFTEVTLPVDEIISGHDNDSLLAAKISFQRLNNEQLSKQSLSAPTTLLMVSKDSLYYFFENRRLTDGKMAFSTTLSSGDNTYTFNNISTMISNMASVKREGLKSDPNWEANHPDWNKVVLVPVQVVQVNTSSGSYYGGSGSTTTNIDHDMSISSTRLVGGGNNPNDPVKIYVVYSKFRNN